VLVRQERVGSEADQATRGPVPTPYKSVLGTPSPSPPPISFKNNPLSPPAMIPATGSYIASRNVPSAVFSPFSAAPMRSTQPAHHLSVLSRPQCERCSYPLVPVSLPANLLVQTPLETKQLRGTDPPHTSG